MKEKKTGTESNIVIVCLRRGEIHDFRLQMKALKGILNNEKACSWGKDIRIINEIADEIQDFPERIKTDELSAMEEDFKKLVQENKGKSPEEVVRSWEKGLAYLEAVKSFNRQYEAFLKEKIEIRFHTRFEINEIHKIDDAATAEMLSWFM